MHLEGVFPTTRGPFLCAHFSSVLAWCGRQSCGTKYLVILLLVAIRHVLYRHCYSTAARVPQCPSHALCKTSASQGVRSRGRSRKGTVQIMEHGVEKSSMPDSVWGCRLWLEPLTAYPITLQCSLACLWRLGPSLAACRWYAAACERLLVPGGLALSQADYRRQCMSVRTTYSFQCGKA